MLKKGLIQIYTGDGKGKTTAAAGQAIRAVGSGLKVCYISFFKNPKRWGYGEIGIIKKLGIDVFHFAPDHPHFNKDADPRKISKQCLQGIDFIEKIFEGKKYDLVILDEIIITVRDGFIKEDVLLKMLKKKPPKMEVVLTGRGAAKALVNTADLVTEMKKVKHPYDKGIKGRKGIER